ncbi:Arylsulfatase [Pirellula sp. SH-Sr6A]|uniref:sulfatase family protein n=1 Tax=Pirellula sp. SH-Sr6A TaxID=1632865 RepID=UPI00078BDABF|nr:sulfatase [Pirellula sp. SH-Sr6A]AMV30835.1 Arylsulfatase [Pirellula sp. SH-Sr6A]
MPLPIPLPARLLPIFGSWLVMLLLPSLSSAQSNSPGNSPARPNILWITSEDNGPQLGCYGDRFASSPHIDALAAKGLRFNQCWSNAPVCAPARTTIITGMYATSFGASNMRSRGTRKPNTLLLPELLRAEGYYCSNNVKEDYNFNATTKPWNASSNKAHWRNRPNQSPFFSVFNFTTTHESQIRTRPHDAKKDPQKVPIPPYHPDLPEVRQDWAQYYDKIEEMDGQVGKVLQELEADGLSDSTIVFYFGDHGSGMPRSKRWLYQSGLHVPMIVFVPEKLRAIAGESYQPSGTSDRLIAFVDLVPTVLRLAGAAIPSYLEGTPFLGTNIPDAPKYAFGFRDRMDERIDMSRAVRNDRYLYIKNFMPFRPQGTYLTYMFQTPTTQVWKKAFDEGKLNEAQSAFWKPKPPEELYDLQSDPFQIHNLAGTEALRSVQQELRDQLRHHMIRTQDKGVVPEAIVKANQVDSNWNWSELVDAAFQGSSLNGPAPNRDSDNPIVRYWAAQRLLVAGANQPTRADYQNACIALLKDSNPSVRIPAAEAACRSTEPDLKRLGFETLLQLCDVEKWEGMQAIAAMNSLVNLQMTIDEPQRKKIGIDPALEPVYREYVTRLLETLGSQQN